MKMIRQIILAFACISCMFLFNQCRKNTVVDEFTYKINKKCPIEINTHLILVNAEAKNESLIYNYKTDYQGELLKDREYLKLSKEDDLYNIASNPGMKPLRDANATIIHWYRNKDNKFLFEVKYTPNEYPNFQLDKKDIHSTLI